MSIESLANCLPELCTESETPTNSGDKGYRCETSNDVLIRCGRIAHLKKKKQKRKRYHTVLVVWVLRIINNIFIFLHTGVSSNQTVGMCSLCTFETPPSPTNISESPFPIPVSDSLVLIRCVRETNKQQQEKSIAVHERWLVKFALAFQVICLLYDTKQDVSMQSFELF